MNDRTFKAYLKRDGQEVEVRRFCIPSESTKSLMFLRSKIKTIFPSIQNDQFSLFWLDNDKDHIAIGSDEELYQALIPRQDTTVRLFINTSSQQHSDNRGNAQAHPVVCDICDQQIVGFRYKCASCPNFDLCPSCEMAGNHPQHLVLRLPTPLMAASCMHPKFFRKFLRPQIHKFSKQNRRPHAFTNIRSGGCLFQEQDRPSTDPNDGPKDMFDFSSLLEYINSMTTGDEPRTEDPQTHTNSQPTNGEQAEQPPPGADYLNGVGQAISSFLGPYGINVSFDVRGPSSTTVGANAQQNTPATQQHASANTYTQQSAPAATYTQQSAPAATYTQQSAPAATYTQQSAPAATSAQQSGPANTSQESTAANTNTAPLFISAEPIPSAPFAAPPQTQDTADHRNSDDWTLLNPECSQNEAMDLDQGLVSGSSLATAPPIQYEVPPIDSETKKIEDGIDLIRSMGLGCNRELLRELLVQSNGDVAVVLNMIL